MVLDISLGATRMLDWDETLKIAKSRLQTWVINIVIRAVVIPHHAVYCSTKRCGSRSKHDPSTSKLKSSVV
jgi:hypothetical protein